MRQAEITNYVPILAILKNVAGCKAHTIVQRSIREDEIVKIFIPTVKPCDNVIRTKTTNLQVGFIHRFRRNS